MTQNEIVLDEILSSGQYVKYIEVADAFLTDKADMMEQDRIINALKQIVRRNLKNALDYKNGKNARDGFKYKNDYKHYLKFLDEKEKLKSKTGNEKRSYATMGLGLLLDDSSTEVNRIEFECVRNLANSSMVKDIANKILNGHVLSLTYRTNKGEEQTVTFHPQYLKEYNNGEYRSDGTVVAASWYRAERKRGTAHIGRMVPVPNVRYTRCQRVPCRLCYRAP